jgi:hypothetical protein
VSGKDGYFDEPVAARYDESDPEMFSPERVDPVVDLLAELAGGGRALELAIGAGRIAVPTTSPIRACARTTSRSWMEPGGTWQCRSATCGRRSST